MNDSISDGREHICVTKCSFVSLKSGFVGTQRPKSITHECYARIRTALDGYIYFALGPLLN